MVDLSTVTDAQLGSPGKLAQMGVAQFGIDPGIGDARILLREILPNLVGPLLSYSLVMFAIAVLAEASLGFLGLSVPPPAPSWGSIISSERANLAIASHVIFVPAAAMFLTVISLNVLGERAQRAYDIRTTES